MPDIFLSYSRDDQATARRFAEAFERAGFSVWWDASLRSGEAYDKVTEKALEDARAVVVLWSKQSVDSRWVRAEATQADRNHTFVPVMIEPCKRPIMFELTHTADLSGWKGDTDDKAWLSFVSDVRRFVDKDASPASGLPISSRPRRISVWMTAIPVVLLLLAGAAWWVSGRHGGHAAAPTATSTAGTAAHTAAAEVTLAVLPFADMSPAHDQEYFSDGLSEEILDQLAKIRNLSVTARTSSFQFKGKTGDMRDIGEKLGVANLLEGSVRKDGNSLRITAQLINAKSGTHLWSQTYDRELSKVFALQEEIAKDVAQALSIKLDVGDMSRARGGTTNIDAYEAYLGGLSVERDQGPDRIPRTIEQYQKAVTLDPSFGLAWLALAQAYAEQDMANGERSEHTLAASEQVRRLIPEAPAYYLALSGIDIQQFAWSDAAGHIQKAREAAARQSQVIPEADVTEGIFLQFVGRFRDSAAPLQRAKRSNPLALEPSGWLTESYFFSGDYTAAAKELDHAAGLQGGEGLRDLLSFSHALSTRDRAALDKSIDTAREMDQSSLKINFTMLHLLDKPAAALAKLHQLTDSASKAEDLYATALWAAYFHDPQFAFQVIQRMETVVGRGGVLPRSIWNPLLTDVRKMPEFRQLVRELKFVDYWRAYGWADLCKPVGTDDFECH